MTISFSRIFLIVSLLIATVGCDQATKSVARDALTKTGPLSFARGSVKLVYAENPGAFLNLGADLHGDLRFWIFTAGVSLFLLIAAIYLFKKSEMSLAKTVGWAFIVAGGAGNLIDRVIFGHVTDFIHLGIGPIRTGIFNIADVAIVVGVLMLLIPEREPQRIIS